MTGVTLAQLEALAARAPTTRHAAVARHAAGATNEEPRARAYARSKDPSIQGNDGSGRLMDAARDIYYGFDLPYDLALRILLEEFNPRCVGPWSEKEIRHKLDDVDKLPYDKPRGHLRDAGHYPAGRGKPTSAGKGLPKIIVGPAEHEVNDQAAAALAADSQLYQRGGELVRVIQSTGHRSRRLDHPSGPIIRTVSAATLRERLTAVADFRKVVKGAEEDLEVPDHPPQSCILAVKDRGDWPGVRPLAGVTDFPVVRPDGTVATVEGYDSSTEVFVGPYGGGVSVPGSLTREDARIAVGHLLETVKDFPFLDDHHRAAWVAALLTPLARFAFEGPAPLTLIEANSPGSGKGLLANTVSVIVTGTRFAVATYAHDSAEMRKVITSLAIAGDRMVLLDNVTGRFGNDALDAALTSTVWRGRVLGENREAVVPLKASWFATGNNLSLFGDMHRRVMHIRLQSPLECPEERAGFEHPDLLEWVRDNRPRLLSAALIILTAFLRLRPPVQLSAFGSFEGWSRTVRAAVVWSGLPDPAATRAGLREKADPEREAMQCLLENWALLDPRGKGLTLARIVDTLKKAVSNQDRQESQTEAEPASTLADVAVALESIAPDLDVKALGFKFRKWKDRIVGGAVLHHAGLSQGSQRWAAKRVSGGHGGLGGDHFALPTATPNTTPVIPFESPSPAIEEVMPTKPTIPTTSGDEPKKQRPLDAELSVDPAGME